MYLPAYNIHHVLFLFDTKLSNRETASIAGKTSLNLDFRSDLLRDRDVECFAMPTSFRYDSTIKLNN